MRTIRPVCSYLSIYFLPPMRLPLFLLVLLAFAASDTSRAQLVTASPQVAVYRYAEPGAPTMEVRVWGAVGTPGLYQVERDTDLLQLLSYAGGPLAGVESDREERDVYVQLARGSSGDRTIILDERLDALLADAAYPEPQDGDIVTVRVETQQKFQLRDLAVFTSSIGTLALVILRIVSP